MKKTFLILFTLMTLLGSINGKAQNSNDLKPIVDTSKIMSTDAKNIFGILKARLDFGGTEFGNFEFEKNGFSASVIGGRSAGRIVSFHIYEITKGKYFVADDINAKFYYYENGQLTPTKFTPQKAKIWAFDPHYKDEGFFYQGNGFDNKEIKEWHYWNGQKFVRDGSLEYAVDSSTVMSDDAKKLYGIVNFDENLYGYEYYVNYEMTRFYKNGFIAVFDGESNGMTLFSFDVSYHIYNGDNKKIVVFADGSNIKFWCYENGTSKEVKNILPQNKSNKKNQKCSYYLNDEGIIYNNYLNDTSVEEKFRWAGKDFVLEK